MNKKEILAITQYLESRKSELIQLLEQLNSDRHREGNPLDKDFSEQAVEAENDEVIDRLHEKANAEINQINQALQNLKQNQYGICAICGELIAEKRLKVLPYAQTCIECAD